MVLIAVMTNLAFSAHKVTLRVAADVLGFQLRSRLRLKVLVKSRLRLKLLVGVKSRLHLKVLVGLKSSAYHRIHICFDGILGGGEEWAEKYNNKEERQHGTKGSKTTATNPDFL